MILHIFDSEQQLARAAAAIVAERLRAQPRLVLGLPTGRTPIALYAQLAAESAGGALDWSGVRTFNLDEFVGVPADAPGSYRAFMRLHLFDHVNIDARHVGFPDGMAGDLEAECARYDAAIRAAGGIDLQLLGIGGNGHVGFNEPGDALDAATHCVTLREETRQANAAWFGGHPSRVPTQALSIGMGAILMARQVVLLATGEKKADAVAGMVEGRVTTQLPASFLQLHAQTTALLDRAAASKLTRRTVASAAAPPAAR